MAFFTADLCDEYPDKVAVLEPSYCNFGGAASCEGEIVTIKLDRNNADLVALLRNQDGTGKVVVVDVDRAYYAVVGENLMNFARDNNYAGIIVNGYVRDTAQIRDIPVALFAMGTCPRKYIPITPGQRDLHLAFGGVDIAPGSYLYADGDGIIVTGEKLC